MTTNDPAGSSNTSPITHPVTPDPTSSSSNPSGGEAIRRAWDNMTHWWRTSVINTVDQTDVIARRRDDAEFSARYIFMLLMAAGIAMLGLLQNSPAVIIGAMLLSPLMGPIMGGGFSLAIGDFNWLRDSARTLLIGTVLSILFCALLVVLSPLKSVTPEIVARTRPNLFDLLIALFSALAGAYAMIRGRENSIVGVAIATALMPPLAVVGFGLATWNGTVFWGALMLFLTNLLTIALSSAIMARLYGFRTRLSQKQTQIQTLIIVFVFVLLAIPLGYSLRQIVFESRAEAAISDGINQRFGAGSRVYSIDIDWNSDPITIDATVGTTELQPDAEAVLYKEIQSKIGRPVVFNLTQMQVDTSSSSAEKAALSANRSRDEAVNRMRVQELTDGLALVAGVQPSQVTVDTDKKLALVRANVLAGAAMATYRQLETRIANALSDWTIQLIPPAVALPEVTFAGREPTDAGAQAIQTIAWASKRRDTPVRLSGPVAAVENVRGKLAELGIRAEVGDEGGDGGVVRATWAAPEASSPVIKQQNSGSGKTAQPTTN